MSKRTVSTIARDAVHNFTHCAAMADAGTEVIITQHGLTSLQPVRAGPAQRSADQELLIQRALAVRSNQPFKDKFARSPAYED